MASLEMEATQSVSSLLPLLLLVHSSKCLLAMHTHVPCAAMAVWRAGVSLLGVSVRAVWQWPLLCHMHWCSPAPWLGFDFSSRIAGLGHICLPCGFFLF